MYKAEPSAAKCEQATHPSNNTVRKVDDSVQCPVSSVQPEKEIEKKEWKYLENAGKLCVVAGQILDVRGFSPFI